nr:uncharacterized protein LOC122272919 [Parasteatoda tepidariorum]
MSQYLPLKDFQWIDPATEVLSTPPYSSTGYILEVDLEYPSDLHDNHSDLPLAPETAIPPGCKEKRLLTTLNNKQRYMLYYQNLQLYLQHGLKLNKVHRILQFEQAPWLKSYIDLNTTLRTAATNDFEKNFYLLMNNAVFGKTMENIRSRVDVKLCGTAPKAEKLIARSNFQERTIFSEDLAAFHMRRTVLTFNKPIVVRMVVLDVSKTLMYDFHYSKMIPKYGSHLKLLYTDTDSFIYNIVTEDVYADMAQALELYDTSDYSPNNIYGLSLVNKKVLRKMKDETKGEVVTEFAGIRSKVYIYKSGTNTVKKLKGVKKAVIEKKISFEDYMQCLFQHKELMTCMNLIRSKTHQIYSITASKIALSPHDQKRHVLADRISTLPFGHYSLRNDDE